jgi:ribosome recycling factor
LNVSSPQVALRNVRRTAVDAVKKLEKDSGISEDESKSAQDEIQKITGPAPLPLVCGAQGRGVSG